MKGFNTERFAKEAPLMEKCDEQAVEKDDLIIIHTAEEIAEATNAKMYVVAATLVLDEKSANELLRTKDAERFLGTRPIDSEDVKTMYLNIVKGIGDVPTRWELTNDPKHPDGKK